MNNHLIKIKEAIIVEGKYDKNTLSQYLSANIIETGGFQIFTRKDIVSLIKKLAIKCGVIILTDSDSAGFIIRNHLKGMIKDGIVRHAYIPDIYGKERRKRESSSEGKLGVEAMSREVILSSLKKAGATIEGVSSEHKTEKRFTMVNLFEYGLSGQPGCSEKRKKLLSKLELPEKLNTSSMLDVLNAIYSYDELIKLFDSHILDTD